MLSPVGLPKRPVTPDIAYTDWVDWFRAEARDTFLCGVSPSMNWHCNIDQHLKATRTTGERPSTPYFEALETQPVPREDDPPDRRQNPDGEGRPPADSIDGANTTCSNAVPGTPEEGHWDIHAQAPDFKDWDDPFLSSPPPPPKKIWGLHCSHKYGTTNTEYINKAWRYDVVTDVEIYRVSTVPEDFVGSGPWNNWTHEVLVA